MIKIRIKMARRFITYVSGNISSVKEKSPCIRKRHCKVVQDVLTNMKHFVCDLDDKDLSVGLNNIVSDVIKKLSHT